MSDSLEMQISVRQPRRGRKRPNAEATPDLPRIPRVARLMALAIKFEGMVACGENGDTLTTCDNAPDPDKGRPSKFEAKSGSGYILITFKRTKP